MKPFTDISSPDLQKIGGISLTDKKKPMKRTPKKEMSNSSVLLQLYNNKVLCSKVDEALDEGVTYENIIELCAMYDFEISTASITRYKNKRKEAIETGVPLEALLDQRKKAGNIVDLNAKKSNALDHHNDMYDNTFDSIDKVYNDIQVLDEVIQKGFNGLKFTETLDIQVAIRAIETKAKITNNSMKGLTLVGLRELKLRVNARTSAMTEVLLRYVPEELHEEVLLAIEEEERRYYSNLDLDEENQRISQALEASGIDL